MGSEFPSRPSLAVRAWPDAESRADFKAAHILRLELLCAVDDVLRAAAVQALAVKGIALALTAYPVPWARPMSDIDLLLREPDLMRARAALEGAGWSTRAPPGRSLTAPLLEIVVLPPRPHPAVPVELHVSMDKIVPRHMNMTELLARAVPLPGAHWIKAPGPEDHLILVALHLASDELRHLPGFVDLETLAKRGIDFDVVVNRAISWRAATPVYIALESLERLTPGLVPRATLRALRPSRVRAALLKRVFPAAEPTVTPRSSRLGMPWIVMQTLLRDDSGTWLSGLGRYAALRAREKVIELRARRRE